MDQHRNQSTKSDGSNQSAGRHPQEQGQRRVHTSETASTTQRDRWARAVVKEYGQALAMLAKE